MLKAPALGYFHNADAMIRWDPDRRSCLPGVRGVSAIGPDGPQIKSPFGQYPDLRILLLMTFKLFQMFHIQIEHFTYLGDTARCLMQRGGLRCIGVFQLRSVLSLKVF